jgi:hypothetical protein
MGHIVCKKISNERKEEIFNLISRKNNNDLIHSQNRNVISGNNICCIYWENEKELEILSNKYSNTYFFSTFLDVRVICE